MFDLTDRRTPEERARDLRQIEVREQNGLLAAGFLGSLRQVLSQQEGLEVGLIGKARYGGGSELLVESDGVVYKLSCEVETS